MSTENPSVEPARDLFFEANLGDARLGFGQCLYSIQDLEFSDLHPFLPKIKEFPEILKRDNIVFLTPRNTAHPIFWEDTTISYRGIAHCRSFQTPLKGNNGEPTYTVVTKGGDILNTADVRNQISRIKNRQIPGSAILEQTKVEFNAAVSLQRLALAKIGRPTHAPLPVAIREIKEVPSSTGQLIKIKDFLNSSEYSNLSDTSRERYGVPKKIPLGDLLIDVYNLQPVEYQYLVEELDIRINELASLLYFSEANNYLFSDPLAHSETGIVMNGVYMENSGKDRTETIFAIYKTLAKAYGFEAADILPPTQVTKENSLRILEKIQKNCQRKGVTEIVLKKFIDHLTEVAALAHSANNIFCSVDGVGGSLIGRNVTYTGVVLDLDTFAKVETNAIAKYIKRDYEELLLSVACMRRLVSFDYPDWLLDYIHDKYTENVRKFTDDEKLWETLENAINTSNLDEIFLDYITYSRTSS